MKGLTRFLAWLTVLLTGGVVVINWPLLAAPASVDVWVGRIDLPWGFVVLALAVPLALLLLVEVAQRCMRPLAESRELMTELLRAQRSTEKAEASRTEDLRRLVVAEFRLVHSRLQALSGAAQTDVGMPSPPPQVLPLHKVGR